MKTIQSLIIVTLCLSFGSCDVPGILIGFSRLASRANFAQCENSLTPFCDDCNTLVKCQNSAIDPPTLTCRTEYPDRPYCADGACTSVEPKECPPKFTCTGAGYYPNPLNCSRYHLCSGYGSAAATYRCPNGFVYNPLTTMCKLSTDCAVIDCSADPTGYFVYPTDNRLFASCNRGEDPLMMRCPPNQVFQPSRNNCEFQCPREGRIAHESDKTRYYECYFNGTEYTFELYQCVTSYNFIEELQQCILPTAG